MGKGAAWEKRVGNAGSGLLCCCKWRAFSELPPTFQDPTQVDGQRGEGGKAEDGAEGGAEVGMGQGEAMSPSRLRCLPQCLLHAKIRVKEKEKEEWRRLGGTKERQRTCTPKVKEGGGRGGGK